MHPHTHWIHALLACIPNYPILPALVQPVRNPNYLIVSSVAQPASYLLMPPYRWHFLKARGWLAYHGLCRHEADLSQDQAVNLGPDPETTLESFAQALPDQVKLASIVVGFAQVAAECPAPFPVLASDQDTTILVLHLGGTHLLVPQGYGQKIHR